MASASPTSPGLWWRAWLAELASRRAPLQRLADRLVPIYLLEERHRIPQLCDTKSVFTIHNIEYQADTAARL